MKRGKYGIIIILTSVVLAVSAPAFSYAAEFTDGRAEAGSEECISHTADFDKETIDETTEKTTIFSDEELNESITGEWVIQDGIIYEYSDKFDGYAAIGCTEEAKEWEDIVIAEYVGECRVVYLKDSVFGSLKNLKTIAIPGTVEHIEDFLKNFRKDIIVKCPEQSTAFQCAKKILVQDNSAYPPELLIKDGAAYVLKRPARDMKYYVASYWFGIKTSADEENKKVENVKYESEIAGIPVTELDSTAVADSSNRSVLDVRSFNIPSSVQLIRNGEFGIFAFVDYTGNDDDWFGYQNLERVTFEDGDTPVKLGKNLFDDCKSLTEVNFSSRVKELPEKIFVDCPVLKRLELPAGLTKIGEKAFCGAKNMEVLHIPSTVAEIADNAMDGLKKLTIFGEKGSYAEKYAAQHGIAFVTLADGGQMPETVVGKAVIDAASAVPAENRLAVSLKGKVNNAEGYDFALGRDSSCTETGKFLLKKSNRTEPCASFNMSKYGGGTYYVACRGWKMTENGKIYGLWSEAQKIKISDKKLVKTKAPVIKSVKTRGGKVTVILSATSYPDGFFCILGKEKDAIRPWKVKYVKRDQTQKTITFTNVKKGIYYIGARSYVKIKGNKNLGPWSGMKKIKVN